MYRKWDRVFFSAGIAMIASAVIYLFVLAVQSISSAPSNSIDGQFAGYALLRTAVIAPEQVQDGLVVHYTQPDGTRRRRILEKELVAAADIEVAQFGHTTIPATGRQQLVFAIPRQSSHAQRLQAPVINLFTTFESYQASQWRQGVILFCSFVCGIILIVIGGILRERYLREGEALLLFLNSSHQLHRQHLP